VRYTASLTLSALVVATVIAQNAPADPKFDAVSIKRSTSQLPGPIFGEAPGGGGFRMTGGTALNIIYSAYPVRNREVIGLPDWARSERYDVVATAGGRRPREEEAAMLQRMLSDRFGFSGHMEDRELPVFALTLATPDNKPRPTMQQLAVDCASYVAALRRGEARTAASLPDGSEPCGYSMQSGAATVLTSKGMTMATLAGLLGTASGRIVVDRTNLAGDYTFTLSYAMPRTSSTGADDGPLVFTALQEQLGLKLEPARAPIDTLVIDHIERPTEN
jgi:uncharacterized protein (TIGR03435 family)